MSLSVAIITLDEEDNLPRCLASLAGLADEIVVVDSLSRDRTRQLAADAGARVVEQAFLGHVRQKQLALELTTGDWVLSLDADEWLDEDLRRAVDAVVESASPDGPAGYRCNRRTFYLGAWIDHGGWSPEWRLRLVRRGTAHWTGNDPHDRLEVDGAVADLPGRLCHRPYRSVSEHVATINRYTDTMATQRHQGGEGPSWTRLLLRPPGRFVRMYLLRAGFLDGWRGLLLASLGAFYVFLKYAKIFVLSRAGEAAPPR